MPTVKLIAAALHLTDETRERDFIRWFDSAFLQGNELNGLPGNANVKVRVIEELGKD